MLQSFKINFLSNFETIVIGTTTNGGLFTIILMLDFQPGGLMKKPPLKAGNLNLLKL